MGNSVTSINKNAFYGCTGMNSLTISDSVTSIGRSAFEGCSGLTSISIGKSVTSIDDNAFQNCSNLRLITICSDDISYPAQGIIFEGCNKVEKIIYSDNCTNATCTGLGLTTVSEVSLPETLRTIGNSAFFCFEKLKEITIPNSVISIGGNAFMCCTGLTSITIPNSVTTIGRSAFMCCSGLTSIAIPNSVTSLGIYAFSGCKNVTSITIGNSVSSICFGAFRECKMLTDMYCLAENVPSTEDEVFDCSNITHATLHVPEASINKYKSTAPWNRFGNIVALLPEDLTNEVKYVLAPKPENDTPALYDLSGHKLEKKPSKGIYIQNGKVLVK